MFRRIHSNRDPDATIAGEVVKEFQVYFSRANQWSGKALSRFPKLVFGVMILCIGISAGLSFTLLRSRDSKPKNISQATQIIRPANNNLGEQLTVLLQTTSALRETYDLKDSVERILGRKYLSKKDSDALLVVLDRLKTLHSPPINNHEN